MKFYITIRTSSITRFVGCYFRNGVDANAVTIVDEALFDKYFV